MSNFDGKAYWVYNCNEEKNDIDVAAYWGDYGFFTLQRLYLRRIIYRWRFCNSRNGWHEESKTYELPQPTSDPITIPGISYVKHLGDSMAPEYWGRKYKVETFLTIISGRDEEILDEDYQGSAIGCFRRGDSNFEDRFICEPPDIQCETTITQCDG